MIPKVTLHPEFYMTNPPSFIGCYVIDEHGKSVGLFRAEELERLFDQILKYREDNTWPKPDIPTKCAECGQVKALYSVLIRDKNKVVRIDDLMVPKWICLECWQEAV